MPYIDFEEDSNYYRGKRSVELFKKKTDNGVDIDTCDINLKNELLQSNQCKDIWNPDPNLTYKFDLKFNNNNSFNFSPNWSIFSKMELGEVQESSDSPFGVFPPTISGGRSTVNLQYNSKVGDFCYSNFQKTFDPNPIFLDFLGSNSFCRHFLGVSESFNTDFTSRVGNEYTFGSLKGEGEIFGTADPHPQGQSPIIKFDGQTLSGIGLNINYTKIKEYCTFVLTYGWDAGKMITILRIRYRTELSEFQFMNVEFINGVNRDDGWVYKYSDIYGKNDSVLDGNRLYFDYDFTINYESAQQTSISYKNFPNYFRDEIGNINISYSNGSGLMIRESDNVLGGRSDAVFADGLLFEPTLIEGIWRN